MITGIFAHFPNGAIRQLCTLMLACSSLSAAVSGWRGDSTGHYPDATPPTRWSADSGVAWSYATSGQSSSTPIIVDQQVILMMDPHWIVSLDKRSGKELWKASITPEDSTDSERQQHVRSLVDKRGAMWQQMKSLKGELGSADAGRKKTIEAELKKLDHERKQLPTFSRKPYKGVGFTCATPISDGTHVFCLLQSGYGACFDMTGKRLWTTWIWPVSLGYGQSMSPALINGILGIHIDDHFFGMELSSGKVLWQQKETQHQGSPIGIMAGTTAVFLGTDGSVFQAKDGKRLTKFSFPALNKFNTPIKHGNELHWIAEGKFLCTATFSEKDGKPSISKRHRGIPAGVFYASLLSHDGRFYLWNDAAKKGQPKELITINQTPKSKDITKHPISGKGKRKGKAYPSPTMAGGFIYVGSDDGTVAVFKPGSTAVETGPNSSIKQFSLEQIAVNSIPDKLWASPVFDGDRLYLRCFKKLYCITGE